jgi:hypothetical protein
MDNASPRYYDNTRCDVTFYNKTCDCAAMPRGMPRPARRPLDESPDHTCHLYIPRSLAPTHDEPMADYPRALGVPTPMLLPTP